jgi:hypothetical protein
MNGILKTSSTPNFQSTSIEEKEEVQAEGIENIFNEIIGENFPSLHKETGT